jgi:hypothetical protein
MESVIFVVSGLAIEPESLALVARLLWQAAIAPHRANIMSDFFIGDYL